MNFADPDKTVDKYRKNIKQIRFLKNYVEYMMLRFVNSIISAFADRKRVYIPGLTHVQGAPEAT